MPYVHGLAGSHLGWRAYGLRSVRTDATRRVVTTLMARPWPPLVGAVVGLWPCRAVQVGVLVGGLDCADGAAAEPAKACPGHSELAKHLVDVGFDRALRDPVRVNDLAIQQFRVRQVGQEL